MCEVGTGCEGEALVWHGNVRGRGVQCKGSGVPFPQKKMNSSSRFNKILGGSPPNETLMTIMSIMKYINVITELLNTAQLIRVSLCNNNLKCCESITYSTN